MPRTNYAVNTKNTAPEVDTDGMPIWARDAKGRPICDALVNRKENKHCESFRLDRVSGRCPRHTRNIKDIGDRYAKFTNGLTSRYAGLSIGKAREALEWINTHVEDYVSLEADIRLTMARLEMMADTVEGIIDEQTVELLENIAARFEKTIFSEDGKEKQSNLRQLKELKTLGKVIVALANDSSRQARQLREMERMQNHLKELIKVEQKTIELRTNRMSDFELAYLVNTLIHLAIRNISERERLVEYGEDILKAIPSRHVAMMIQDSLQSAAEERAKNDNGGNVPNSNPGNILGSSPGEGEKWNHVPGGVDPLALPANIEEDIIEAVYSEVDETAEAIDIQQTKIDIAKAAKKAKR